MAFMTLGHKETTICSSFYHNHFRILILWHRDVTAIASDALSSCDDIAAGDLHRDWEKSLQDLQMSYAEARIPIKDYLLKCASIYRPKKVAL